MFKRAVAAFSLLVLSALACAQQSAYWPWQPVQIWVAPANGQALPFPTPFWLWVVPPQATPAAPVPGAVPTPAPVPAAEPAPAAVPAAPAAPAAKPAAAPDAATVPPPPVVAGETAPAPSASPAPPAKSALPTKKAAKPAVRAAPKPAAKARKLCFKDGKLDVCP